jgi:hypothetical protein
VKVEPEPLAGEPPVAVHANVYGEVPPEADALQLTATPAVPDVGQVSVTVRGSAAMVTLEVRDTATVLASVTVTTML